MSKPLSRRAVLYGVAASLTTLPAPAQAPAGLRVLEARPGRIRLSGARETGILGFDGTMPGPVLRYRQGDELAVRFLNKMDRPATIHWHGLRGDNAMEGVAPLTQAPIAPGASFDYRRKLSEPGLFCYRPSVYGATPELVGRGLKGLLLVDEPAPLQADADLLLVLDDWLLDDAGEVIGGFDDPAASRGVGRIGSLLCVNGAAAPAAQSIAPGARVRLRLANLSNARIMVLSVVGAQPFVIAIDGQPCEAFEPIKRSIPVAPGARFELMFYMPETEGAKASLVLRGPNGEDRDLFVADAKGPKALQRPPIVSLPPNSALPAEIRLGEAKKVDLVIEPRKGGAGPAWTINGAPTKAYEGPALFKVAHGTPVTLGFVNRSGVALAMHVHGQCMRLLHDLDDGWEPYWRNGVIVPPGKTKHAAFLVESPGKWAIHDDILEHEARGLATWFEAT
ncbi:multicopper oxidase domain-containing protein [Methylocystis sp.]|uniref:multicopper oxidase family protein n=1 Tax=Methylocystis sp. TaxID=1911079 RepID=UPI0025CD4075|nr:multicopper oxidase domain-containing protein [Methylocystis sp.]